MAKKSICVLETDIGIPLVIRSGPTLEEIQDFVVEHNRRHDSGLHEGPAEIHIASKILAARIHSSEESWNNGGKGKPVDISSPSKPNIKE